VPLPNLVALRPLRDARSWREEQQRPTGGLQKLLSTAFYSWRYGSNIAQAREYLQKAYHRGDVHQEKALEQAVQRAKEAVIHARANTI